MHILVLLLKALLLPAFALVFFGGFSTLAVLPIMNLFPSFTNSSMTYILLSSVAQNLILISLAAAIIAFPAAYIYKKLAPLAALAIYMPVLFFSIDALNFVNLNQVFSTVYPLIIELILIPLSAHRARLYLDTPSSNKWFKSFASLTRDRLKPAP
ncbi:hypothetical protein [Pseudomonas sp. EA_35y_Pfl2_R5]|uniref:hypothetical protein n=1 Tax=Pseudomonas sp. EA_35y_Pfl2_R5 TaxID=3088690 RepID=UPI0030DD6B29